MKQTPIAVLTVTDNNRETYVLGAFKRTDKEPTVDEICDILKECIGDDDETFNVTTDEQRRALAEDLAKGVTAFDDDDYEYYLSYSTLYEKE